MFVVVRFMRIMEYAMVFVLAAVLAVIGFSLPNKQAAEAVSGTVAGAVAGGTVLVIDAGHGGADGGAVASDGTVESAINLDICLKMEALAAFCGQETVMTRSSEAIDYPESADSISEKKVADQKARVALINSIENAVLISVHQNIFPDPRPRGSQALYADTGGSEALGGLIHANLIAALYPENRRVASPIQDSIYLMKNVTCTAVLVECGFLSNPEESALLETDGYRLKIAVVLLGSFLEYERGVQ